MSLQQTPGGQLWIEPTSRAASAAARLAYLVEESPGSDVWIPSETGPAEAELVEVVADSGEYELLTIAEAASYPDARQMRLMRAGDNYIFFPG